MKNIESQFLRNDEKINLQQNMDEAVNVLPNDPHKASDLLYKIIRAIEKLHTIQNPQESDNESEELREFKKKAERMWQLTLIREVERMCRLAVLLSPANTEDFDATLRWVSQQGDELELKQISMLQKSIEQSNYPILSGDLKNLLNRAQKKIEERIQTKNQYKIFAPQHDLNEFKLKIVNSYPAYTIITGASSKTISEVKKKFRIQQMRNNSEGSNMPDTGNSRDRVVRFNAPILESWKQKIEELGAKFLQPLGGLDFVVSIPNQEIAERISNFDEVAQVTPYVPTIRVQPQSLQNLGQPATKEAIAAARLNAARNANNAPPRNLTLPGILVAVFFTTQDRDRAAQNLESIPGIRIADRPGKDLLIIDISAATNAIDLLKIISAQEGLRSLDEKTIPRLFNEKAGLVIAKGVIPSNPIATLGLTGKGEIIAIADTGLDTGDPELMHLDFQGRVIDIRSYPITQGWWETYIDNMGDDDGPSDKYSGHGTHVAGSAVGNGLQAISSNVSSAPTGIASEAKLIFQSVEQTAKWTLDGILRYIEKSGVMPPRSGLFGIPDDITDLFEYSYQKGARIHSNSWGGGGKGYYNPLSLKLDEFVWDKKDFLVVIAAGNSGRHSSSGTIGIDQCSVDYPGTAKNCLTVGASENDRSGQFSDTYGNQYPNQFPYEPYKSVNIADSIDDIAPFSSRGPCLDEYQQPARRKPDVVAPGTFILSTRSSQIASNNFADGAYPPAKYHYMYMHGTSMATPLVAGCAALVRQFLREKYQPSMSNPSAALVKAILIHSAQYIKYRYAHPASAPWADNEQGWGRVDLQKVLKPARGTKAIFIDEANGLTTGENRIYKVKITKSSVPLRVTLVYTDYPGENLINNLNLVVHSPSGKHYLGNDFQGTGNPDTIHNVEGVIVESPETGEWTIEIIADVVNEGTQDYAMVISGSGASLLGDSTKIHPKVARRLP